MVELDIEIELDDNGEPIVEVIKAEKRYAPNTPTQLGWVKYNEALVLAYRQAKADRSPKGLTVLSDFERCSLTGETWIPRRHSRTPEQEAGE